MMLIRSVSGVEIWIQRALRVDAIGTSGVIKQDKKKRAGRPE
jgi:hypothetical protein